MPRAGTNPNTGSVSRRNALIEIALAAATMTAATVPAMAGAPSAIAELTEARLTARRCWKAHGDAADCADDSPEQERHDAIAQQCYGTMDAQLDRIARKPKLSLSDLAAVALIARLRSNYAGDPDSIEDDLRHAHEKGDAGEYAGLLLMAGVLELAEGQANG